VALPVNIALGIGEFGLDIYTQHLIEQHEKGEFKSSKELNAFIAGTALAMGPSGMALGVGMFGGTGMERKVIDLGEVGGKGIVDIAKNGGMIAADVTGKQLEFTAQGIDTMADMIRNPDKYAKQLEAMGMKAVDLGKQALQGLADMSQKAGEL